MSNSRRAFAAGILEVAARNQYINKVKSIEAANLIGYWPMNEGGGTTIYDKSGNGRNGIYTNVLWGYQGIGDGNGCPYFDGTAKGNLYSAGFAGAYDGNEVTVSVWGAVRDLAMWTEDAYFTAFHIGVDNTNYFQLQKNINVGLNGLIGIDTAGGTTKYRMAASTTTAFFHVTLTLSKSNDRLRMYFGGAKQGADVNGLGAWGGVLANNRCWVGSCLTGTSFYWQGRLAHLAVWNKELTGAEVLALSTLNP